MPEIFFSKKRSGCPRSHPSHKLYSPARKDQAYLTREQFLLYQLIWRRFLASQMVPAIYDTVSADLMGGEGIILRATGSIMKFPGFLAVYEEKEDEEKDDENRMLPDLGKGRRSCSKN